MPIPEDIGKAYRSYYTHKQIVMGRASVLKRVVHLAEQSYVRGKFGYPRMPDFWQRHLGKLMYLFPIWRRNLEVGARFLKCKSGGKVLDVGCGAGSWLAGMQKLGWDVEGVDFDPGAVRSARGAGLKVHCGSIEEQNYPPATFDAVTLNHVIEHVPNPIETLKECVRILKPGGKLVVITPNGGSLGHRLFKQDWRGMETPRHLHVFSMSSMKRLLDRMDVREISLTPQIVMSLLYESYLLREYNDISAGKTRRHWPAWLRARQINFFELFMVRTDPSAADCIAAVAVKG